jgi:hypothetical protein
VNQFNSLLLFLPHERTNEPLRVVHGFGFLNCSSMRTGILLFLATLGLLAALECKAYRPVASNYIDGAALSQLGAPDPSATRCSPVSAIPIAGHNLTAEELATLEHICWPSDLADTLFDDVGNQRGIPPGVSCTPAAWCDGVVCSDVCARGSVALDPWLANAIRLQSRLSRALPLCYAPMLGTHNSAISLADGYGNLDRYFQQALKYIKWASADLRNSVLRTNDQWLSLTDQLNLGVRVIELDTHWIDGSLRIAHCGGLHLGALNTVVRAINLALKLLHRTIRWDTETLGCSPSLSSIPSQEQRSLTDALKEIKGWMDEVRGRAGLLNPFKDVF